MARKRPRRLVIDTSIARAAGGEGATFPTSKRCRDLLIAVVTICHQVVLTPDIVNEWNRNQSGFARRWRVSMEARRKVERINVAPDVGLRQKVEDTSTAQAERDAMRKDCHLLEAALAADKIILSLDDTVRSLFATASQHVGELHEIMWSNPDILEEGTVTWLENGAKVERQRLLRRRGQEADAS